MKNKFTLIINSGRSGSTFLFQLLRQNYGDSYYLSHEDIPVQVSKPRLYNRKYQKSEISVLKQDVTLMRYIHRWQEELKVRPVIETGWTAYHLAPLLHDIFKDNFQIIILHRDPISFAFSRANMGNFHKNTFYTNHHEVNPFDIGNIVPEYQELWQDMNHFEKCMFWWYVVYKEAFEFRTKFPDVPCLVLKSKELFNFSRFDELIDFLQLKSNKSLVKDVSKNELAQFMRETFPVNNEWVNYKKHPDILNFAEALGHAFNNQSIIELSKKYSLPKGVMPLLRHKINYWKLKSKLRQCLKI